MLIVPIGSGITLICDEIQKAAAGKKAGFISLLDVKVDSVVNFEADEARTFVSNLNSNLPRFGFFELLKEGLSQPKFYPGINPRLIT